MRRTRITWEAMRTVEAEVLEGFSRDELILMLSRFRRKFHQPPLSVPTFYRYCDCLSILNNPCQIPFCFPPSPYHSHPRFTCHNPNFRSGNGSTGKRSKTQTTAISSVWFGPPKAVPKRSGITSQCCSIKRRFQKPSSNLTGHLRMT